MYRKTTSLAQFIDGLVTFNEEIGEDDNYLKFKQAIKLKYNLPGDINIITFNPISVKDCKCSK